jgi:hypothetical protein
MRSRNSTTVSATTTASRNRPGTLASRTVPSSEAFVSVMRSQVPTARACNGETGPIRGSWATSPPPVPPAARTTATSPACVSGPPPERHPAAATATTTTTSTGWTTRSAQTRGPTTRVRPTSAWAALASRAASCWAARAAAWAALA